jgi:hypothetical protein
VKYPGFVGGSYKLRNSAASNERAVNLYPEKVESAAGKAAIVLNSRPGQKALLTLPDSPAKALYALNGRAFAVAGTGFYEIFANWTYKLWGNITQATDAQIVANNYQLLIRSGATLYVFDLNKNTLALGPPDINSLGSQGIGTIDNYGISAVPLSRQFNISSLNDFTQWAALDFAIKEDGPDNISAIFADHRELWLFGLQTSEVWWDSGNADFPFQRIQGAYLEVGCGAAGSVAKADNSLFWVSEDQRGARFVWKANGYVPARISTHAVEYAMSTYPTIADATAYSYTEDGHAFYVVSFPTANTTWVYDAATGIWHEREYWNAATGTSNRVRAACHMWAFGRHLVGDYLSGKIYDQSLAYWDDDGEPIRRIRVAPPVYAEHKRMTVSRMEVLFQTGNFPSVGQGAAPTAVLQISRDGGNKWGNEITGSMGAIGQFDQRVFWTRLGQARQWTPRVTVTDPVPVCMVDAYIDVAEDGN